jgi:sugar/nucleoside kinase (ribokinase family)
MPIGSSYIAGVTVDAQDTAGAGDVFIAGLLHGILMADLNW